MISRTAVGTYQERTCSFCGNPQSEVGPMFAGRDENVFICRGCLRLLGGGVDQPYIDGKVRRLEQAISNIRVTVPGAAETHQALQTLAESLEAIRRRLEKLEQLANEITRVREEVKKLAWQQELANRTPSISLADITPDQAHLIPDHQWREFYRDVLGIPEGLTRILWRKGKKPEEVLSATITTLLVIDGIGEKYAKIIIAKRDEYLARHR